MSHEIRKLQDEAAIVATKIESLQGETPADETRAAAINEELSVLVTRAGEIEKELDSAKAANEAAKAAIAGLRGRLVDTESRSEVKANVRKAPAIGYGKVRGFADQADAVAAGRFLRSLARGEVRAMGETSPTYDEAGAELVSAELFRGFIDVLNYSSVGVQLASVYTTSSNTLTVPKIGEIEAEWISEAAGVTNDDVPTDGVEILLHKLARSVQVSNELIEDAAAVVNLASLVANRFALAFAKAIDTAWLQGVEDKITGLVGQISGGHTKTISQAATPNDLAEMVGYVDPFVQNPAWVVSPLGWAHVLAAAVSNSSQMLSDGVRPMVFGAPVYKCHGLPAGTIALYGDFSMATAVAVKANGLQVAASEHARFANDEVVFRGTQRVGIANHDASMVAKLVLD